MIMYANDAVPSAIYNSAEVLKELVNGLSPVAMRGFENELLSQSRARKQQASSYAYVNPAALYVSRNRHARVACSTFLKWASSLRSCWKMDYPNIALVESNIELIGYYHTHHTWITNFKRIRPPQNTFNLIFL